MTVLRQSLVLTRSGSLRFFISKIKIDVERTLFPVEDIKENLARTLKAISNEFSMIVLLSGNVAEKSV